MKEVAANMENLDSLRVNIDKIDTELTKLFEKRMETVLKIGKYKIDNNIPVVDNKRAGMVVEKAVNRLSNKAFSSEITEIFSNIISVSESTQKTMFAKESMVNSYLKNLFSMPHGKQKISKETRVVYQGVEGAFGSVALNKYFGKENVTVKNVEEFEEVFIALSNNQADFGILPIENSQTGSIAEVYDLFRKYPAFIIGEIDLAVVQNLLGVKGAKLADVKTVYSHIQGFLQSKAFLEKHKNISQIPMSNTAISAQYVSSENDISKAAIASSEAAEKYGLDIIEESINTDRNSQTRFIVISNKIEYDDEASKISLSFTLPNISGSLSRVLLIFAKNNLNMIKIESRPSLNKNFEYFFYVDISGNLSDEKVKNALLELANTTNYFEVLGNYQAK